MTAPYPQQVVGGYPTQYPSYPEQQFAYPPGYPQYDAGYTPPYPPVYPATGGYPEQQQHFTSEAPPDYPYPLPQNDAPPPPYYGQPALQQPVQRSTNVVVVTQQPTVTTTAYTSRYASSDHYFAITIFVMVFCFIFGSFLTLLCTIPALLSSMQAKEAEKRGEHLYAAIRDRRTISLNISAVVFGIVFIIVVVANVATRAAVLY